MPDVGVERRDSREAFHETGDARRAPACAPFCFTRARAHLLTSASWARNVPRQHRLNSLGVTTTSLLLELVTQRAGPLDLGQLDDPRTRCQRTGDWHWLRSTEASDKHALETLRGGEDAALAGVAGAPANAAWGKRLQNDDVDFEN
jgi:hypothetical protein